MFPLPFADLKVWGVRQEVFGHNGPSPSDKASASGPTTRRLVRHGARQRAGDDMTPQGVLQAPAVEGQLLGSRQHFCEDQRVVTDLLQR